NPNINLIPFSDGFSLSFILNILLFVPLGFLCPLISKTFERLRNTFLIGFGLSLFIETIQLFTLHRATDIDDLLTNVIGTIIGYFCFKLIAKLRIVKLHSDDDSMEQDYT
ncbi:VanZ family protein, partial [Vitellibacter sp. q18]|nr:VanZ family protein [Aequorivita lutea]